MVTNVSASQTVATVIAVEGQAFARSPSGQMRPLSVGNSVQEGDTIVTLADGQVQLALVNGQTLSLSANESFQFSPAFQPQPVATVIAAEGQVFARGADGQLRPLKAGDVVLEDETIVTMADGNVQLQTLDGQLLNFLPNETFKFSAETSPNTSPDPAEAILPAGEAGRIIQALQSGGDIDDELESTEAGLDSGSLHDETGDTVRLLRIVEAVTDSIQPEPASDETGAPQAGGFGGGSNVPPPLVTTPLAPPTVALASDSGSSSSDRITNDGTLSVTGLKAGTTVQYSTDGGITWTTNFTPVEGHNSVSVRQVDTSGNASASTTLNFTLDTTPPNITVNAPNNISDTTPTISGTTNAANGTIVTLTVTDSSGTTQTLTAIVNNGTFSAIPGTAMAKGSYTVVASVSDIAGNSNTDSDSGTIVDNAPVLGDYTVALDENVAAGSAVQTVAATDADGDTVTYSITGGNPDGIFTIDTNTGAISIAAGKTLDYETASQHVLTITASDGTNTDTGTVTVNVNNLNDNAPVLGDYTVNLDEEIAAGTAVQTVSATDADGNTVTYSITGGNPDGIFEIDANTGAVTIAAGKTLDYETASQHVLTITASDGTNTDTGTVTVNVNDINDSPVATNDTGAVNEGATLTINAASGVLANDTDINGDTLAVTAVNGQAGDVGVAVAGTYGTLTLNADGSYSYVADNADSLPAGVTANDTFTYTVSDGIGGIDTATLTITLTGTNDIPVFGGVSTGSVTEDLSVVSGNLTSTGTLTVTDADTGESAIDVGAGVTSTGTLGNLIIDANGNWTYTVSNDAVQYLSAGETRDEVFTVTTVDGTTHDITVTIQGTQDNPTVQDNTVPVPKNTSHVLTVENFGINDPDAGDTLTVTILTLPPDGTLWHHNGTDWVMVSASDVIPVEDIANNLLVFVPATNDTGPESFTFTLSDGTTTTAPATLTFSIDTELSVSSPLPVDEGKATVFVVELSDPRAVATDLALSLGGEATAGDDYSTTLQYRVQDPVTGTYGPWTTVSGDVTLPAGSTRIEVKVVTLSDAVDNENESLNLTATITSDTTGMANASATGETYINDSPSLLVSGPSYVSEGGTAVFDLELSAPKDTATSVTLSFAGLATLGTDFEYSIDGGTTWISNPTTVVTLPADSVSSPTFEVHVRTLSDATAEIDELVTLVATANDTGIANDGISVSASAYIVEPVSTSTSEDTPLILTPDTGYTYSVLGQPAHGVVVDNGNGTLTYTPDANYSGTDSFTVTKTNEVGVSVTTTVSVGVTAVADAPTVTIDVSDVPVNVADPEINAVSNGDFATNSLTGWTAGKTSSGTFSAATGALQLSTGSQTTHIAWAEQQVTGLTSGTVYTFDVDITGSAVVKWNGTTLTPISTSGSTNTYQVTAGATNTIRFESPAVKNTTVTVDNVTLMMSPGSSTYTYTVNVDAALVDTDGSETLGSTIVITSSNLPAGAVLTLSDGTTVVPDDDASGAYSWTVTQAQATGLQLTVDKSTGTQFTLTATASSTETVGGSTAQGSATTALITMPADGTNTPNEIPVIDSASVTLSNIQQTATLGTTFGDGTNTFSWVSIAESLPQLYANGELITYTFNPDPAPDGNQTGTITGSTSQGDVFELVITYNSGTGQYDVSYVQYASLQGTLIEATGETMATGGGNGDNLLLTFNTGTETFSAVITGENYLDGTATTINTNNKYIGAANNLMNPNERITMNFASGSGNAVASMQISFFNFDSEAATAPDELTVYGTTVDGTTFSYTVTNADLDANGMYTITAPGDALIAELTFEAGSQSSFKLGIESVSAVQYNPADSQLDLTYQLTDVDGDSATGSLSVTLSGSDAVIGTSGNDTLTGTSFNDLINGGEGNDILTGGLGADTFKWSLADAGTPGTPAVDTITDFDLVADSDKLDLRDLLQSESAGTLTDYLHFEQSGADTIIQISSTGGFSGGYSAGATDQTIVLSGVDLVGTYGTDANIITNLLNQGKLITD